MKKNNYKPILISSSLNQTISNPTQIQLFHTEQRIQIQKALLFALLKHKNLTQEQYYICIEKIEKG